MTKTIDIKLIDANPWRDFELYPLDTDQVESLKHSVEDTGFWLGVLARKHPTKEGRFQLAFGHHRLAAAKKAGLKELQVEVRPLDDDQMIKIMASENATQRVNNAAASLDSVAAIVKRLAKLLVSKDGEKTFRTIVPKGSYDHLKGQLLNGKGIGQGVILDFAPTGTLDEKEVKTALGVLKDSGHYDTIVSKAIAEYNKETGHKPGANDPKPKQHERVFDEKVAQKFKNQHQLDTYRKMVTDPVNRRYIPVDKQAELADMILDTADQTGRELTGARIREQVANVVSEGSRFTKKATAEDKSKQLSLLMDEALEKIRSAAYLWAAGTSSLLALDKRGAVPTPTQIDKYRMQTATFDNSRDELDGLFGVKRGKSKTFIDL